MLLYSCTLFSAFRYAEAIKTRPIDISLTKTEEQATDISTDQQTDAGPTETISRIDGKD